MIWVCKTILSKVLDKCYFLQKIVEAFTTPTNIIESFFCFAILLPRKTPEL